LVKGLFHVKDHSQASSYDEKGLPMQLATFTKGLDNVSEWSGRIFMWLIIPLTLVVVYEVVSTKFFDTPHIWAPEDTA
jgi:hypothetical protein